MRVSAPICKRLSATQRVGKRSFKKKLTVLGQEKDAFVSGIYLYGETPFYLFYSMERLDWE